MNIQELLRTRAVVVTDGATGTYFQTLGYAGATPEDAVITHPALVERAHRDYADAGARILLTDTFGVSRPRMIRRKMESQMAQIIETAVALAGKVKKDYPDILLAGDMGPLGELLEPYGPMSAEQAGESFAEQAVLLAGAGVDFFLLETFADLVELGIACRAVKERTGLPVIASVSVSPGNGFRTMMGQTLDQIAAWANREQPDAVGANCGVGSAQMADIIGQLAALTKIPLWAKPNAGLPVLRDGKTIFPESPEEFARNCAEAVRRGARFIGGCCGATPAHISALSRLA